MKLDRSQKKIVRQLSQEFRIPEKVVELAICSYWMFMKEKVETIDIDSITKENNKDFKMNIRIGSIGTLKVPYDRIIQIKNKQNQTDKNERHIEKIKE